MIYALYKNEEILAIGTVYEIAEKMNVKLDTILYYKTNAYKRKIYKRNAENVRLLIPID